MVCVFALVALVAAGIVAVGFVIYTDPYGEYIVGPFAALIFGSALIALTIFLAGQRIARAIEGGAKMLTFTKRYTVAPSEKETEQHDDGNSQD